MSPSWVFYLPGVLFGSISDSSSLVWRYTVPTVPQGRLGLQLCCPVVQFWKVRHRAWQQQSTGPAFGPATVHFRWCREGPGSAAPALCVAAEWPDVAFGGCR